MGLPRTWLAAFVAVAVSAVSGCSPTSPGPGSSRSTGTSSTSLFSTHTYTLSGTVTEPGAGPIAGVTVTVWPASGGAPRGQALTDDVGQYAIPGVFGCVDVDATRSEYERAGGSSCSKTADVTMQRVILIAAGDSLDNTVLAREPRYGGYGPSKIVHIVPAATGTLFVAVTWQGATDALGLLLGDFAHFSGPNSSSGTIDVTAGQETVAMVRREAPHDPTDDQPFHLDSRMLAPGEKAPASSTAPPMPRGAPHSSGRRQLRAR